MMPDLFTTAGVPAAPTIDLAAQVAEARRELEMRNRLYPRWVESGKMTAERAQRLLALQEAIIATLERVRDAAASTGSGA